MNTTPQTEEPKYTPGKLSAPPCTDQRRKCLPIMAEPYMELEERNKHPRIGSVSFAPKGGCCIALEEAKGRRRPLKQAKTTPATLSVHPKIESAIQGILAQMRGYLMPAPSADHGFMCIDNTPMAIP